MGGIAHSGEVRKCAQHGVGGLVVTGVVAVAGKAFADGIEVQQSYTAPFPPFPALTNILALSINILFTFLFKAF